MTNFEAYQLYMRDVPSSQAYIDWSFYYLISAALQRRVWLSGQENAIYPNAYVIFTGVPGTGKSLASSVTKSLLAEHVRVVGEKRLGDAIRQLPMFPIAADSTTFESLVEETHLSMQVHEVSKTETYFHQSITFILDELSSIFKQNAEDITTFLLSAYSGFSYVRKTRHKGQFSIARPLVGILGSTVIDNLRELIKRRILDTGLAARTIFVHSKEPRFRQMLIPQRDEQQVAARAQLSKHVGELHKVYGNITYEREAYEFLDKWWQDKASVVTNPATALAHYFERKALHVNKLAIVCLFMEQTERRILTMAEVKRAIKILDETERMMHIPLSGGGRNELYTISIDVFEFIRAHGGKARELEIVSHFLPQATGEELTDILLTLQNTGRLRSKLEEGRTVYEVT